MSCPHHDLYNYFGAIRSDGDKAAYEARVPVLMYLIITGNRRMRTWHSMKSIIKNTGYSKSRIIEALSYLEARGAIYNVPSKQRAGNEKKIHGNRKIWQLTGIIAIENKVIDYLFLKKDDRESALLELAEHAPPEVQALYRKAGIPLEYAKLGSQDEPELSPQDEPENTTTGDLGSQDEPQIGSQDDTTKELNEENLIKDKDSLPDGKVLELPELKPSTTPDEPKAPPVVEQKVEQTKLSKAQRDEWYEAVRDVFGESGGLNVKRQKFLRGELTPKHKGEWLDNQLPPGSGLTPALLLQWGNQYKRDNPGISIVKKPIKVQSALLTFLDVQKKQKSIPHIPPKPPANLALLEAQGSVKKESA